MNGPNYLLWEAKRRLAETSNRLDWIIVGLCALVIVGLEVWK